jgi:hypothetical protein
MSELALADVESCSLGLDIDEVGSTGVAVVLVSLPRHIVEQLVGATERMSELVVDIACNISRAAVAVEVAVTGSWTRVVEAEVGNTEPPTRRL